MENVSVCVGRATLIDLSWCSPLYASQALLCDTAPLIPITLLPSFSWDLLLHISVKPTVGENCISCKAPEEKQGLSSGVSSAQAASDII